MKEMIKKYKGTLICSVLVMLADVYKRQPQSVKQAIIDSVEDLSDYPRVGCGPLKEAIADYEYTKPKQQCFLQKGRKAYIRHLMPPIIFH